MKDWFSLKEKSVLITGGTRGIGRAISYQFAQAGARVVANYVRNEEAAREFEVAMQQENLEITFCKADLTSQKGLDILKECVAGQKLTGMVFCAATGIHKPFEELTGRHFDFTMALNVRAFFDTVQLILPDLRKGASIVGVSSEGAVHAYPTYSLIGASKGSLESLCRHMAVEFAERGLRVNVLSPGSVITDAWDAFPDKQEREKKAVERCPRGVLTTPEEVALVAQFLLSDASIGVSGHTLVVDGGQRIRG